jgi:hypothetical protein
MSGGRNTSFCPVFRFRMFAISATVEVQHIEVAQVPPRFGKAQERANKESW